jgi:hypothetical protein
VSLNGHLPPNWPATFPIPSGATAAGSGSLAKGGSGVIVGVYTTSQAPEDVYDDRHGAIGGCRERIRG